MMRGKKEGLSQNRLPDPPSFCPNYFALPPSIEWLAFSRVVVILHRMNPGRLNQSPVIGVTVALGLSLAGRLLAGDVLPDAATIMNRVVQRSQQTAHQDDADQFCYEKHSVQQELDASGNPTKTTEELYEVIPIGGVPFPRLVRIQGKALTDKQVKEQERKEAAFRKKVAEHQTDPGATNRGGLDKELIDRFAFHVEKRENLQDRPVLVLSFRPKLNRAGEKTIEDKVLGRLAGTLWIDEQESEIAQLKVGLTADLSLGWFGMIGSIKQFDLMLQRERLPQGVWVDRKQTLVLAGRKILGTMHYRTEEESTGFRKP